ncbi:hypothetical protein AVEN_100257-1 [Araneus ventricosus]|uniref:Uncharacterized protein n=1 Tax=Araneus ventricosus TaxID=182803 RepID=A0A4Y2VIV8_ARAVE|nr:hypothetical protein AVEN_266558-1 [Araneus ventricosus]GBO24576.1 hypothetical protein AVEN_177218-1 [Araneus ventricosus]GBO25184.1 hypothetical protein AVEN_244375-1 [Araneus ventricosus]GBO25196.1 hypothetical protein AVEN_100257-1 [Araneus ventricosus]
MEWTRGAHLSNAALSRHGGLEVVTKQEISILKADEIMQNLKTIRTPLDLTRWSGRSLQLAGTFVPSLMNAILGLTRSLALLGWICAKADIRCKC